MWESIRQSRIQHMGTMPATPSSIHMHETAQDAPSNFLLRIRIHPELISPILCLGAEVYAQENIGVDNLYVSVSTKVANKYKTEEYVSLILCNLDSLYEAFKDYPTLLEDFFKRLEGHYGSSIRSKIESGSYRAWSKNAENLLKIQAQYAIIAKVLRPIIKEIRQAIEKYFEEIKNYLGSIQENESIHAAVRLLIFDRLYDIFTESCSEVSKYLEMLDDVMHIVDEMDHSPARLYALLAAVEYLAFISHLNLQDAEESDAYDTESINKMADEYMSVPYTHCEESGDNDARRAGIEGLIRVGVCAEQVSARYVRRINWLALYLYNELRRGYAQEFGEPWQTITNPNYQKGHCVEELFENLLEAYNYVVFGENFLETLTEDLAALNISIDGKPIKAQISNNQSEKINKKQATSEEKRIYEEYKNKKRVNAMGAESNAIPSKLTLGENNAFSAYLHKNLSSLDAFKNFLNLNGQFTPQSLSDIIDPIFFLLEKFLNENLKWQKEQASAFIERLKREFFGNKDPKSSKSCTNFTKVDLNDKHATLMKFGLVSLDKFKAKVESESLYIDSSVQSLIDRDEQGKRFKEEIDKLRDRGGDTKIYRPGSRLFEYRFKLEREEGRIIFTRKNGELAILHAFYKTSDKISKQDNDRINNKFRTYEEDFRRRHLSKKK